MQTGWFLAVYNVTTRANVTRHWAKADGFPRCGAPLGVESEVITATTADIECARCARLGPVAPPDPVKS